MRFCTIAVDGQSRPSPRSRNPRPAQQTSATHRQRRNPHSGRGTLCPRQTSRGFLPWRFSDAGPAVRRDHRAGPASENLHKIGSGDRPFRCPLRPGERTSSAGPWARARLRDATARRPATASSAVTAPPLRRVVARPSWASVAGMVSPASARAAARTFDAASPHAPVPPASQPRPHQ